MADSPTIAEITRVTLDRYLPKLRRDLAEEIEVLTERPDLRDCEEDSEKLAEFGRLVRAKREANGTLSPLDRVLRGR